MAGIDITRHDDHWVTDWVIQLPAWGWTLVIALLVFDVGFCLFRLTRSLWSNRLRMVTIGSNVIWISMLGIAASQPGLLTTEVTQVPDLVPFVDRILRGVLAVVCVVLVWDTATHLWRLRSTTNERSKSSPF